MRGVMIAATAAVIAGLAVAPPAHAADWALNGTFTATSNGEWARSNDIFHDQKSVRAIWTVSSVCSYPTECSGTVTSDQGWTAPIYQTGGEWYVKHVVPQWIPCQDGSVISPSNTLIGEDATTGPSGACGRSLPIYITLPFKLVKLG